MPIRIAINGFGRIGKNIVRALYERGLTDRIELVAINDLGSPDVLAHLLQFDTVHGRFAKHVEAGTDSLSIDNHTVNINV